MSYSSPEGHQSCTNVHMPLGKYNFTIYNLHIVKLYKVLKKSHVE